MTRVLGIDPGIAATGWGIIEVNGNKFKISGGQPGMEVSWQVTGIRQDAFANANRIQVEELKKDKERGKYLHPEAFNMPRTAGVDYDKRAIEIAKNKYIKSNLTFINKDAFDYMGFDRKIVASKVAIGWIFFLGFLLLGSKVRNEFWFSIWHVIFILILFGQIIHYQYNDGLLTSVLANSLLIFISCDCNFLSFPFT